MPTPTCGKQMGTMNGAPFYCNRKPKHWGVCSWTSPVQPVKDWPTPTSPTITEADRKLADEILGNAEIVNESTYKWATKLIASYRQQLVREARESASTLVSEINLALPHLPRCDCDTEVGFQCAQCYIAMAVQKYERALATSDDSKREGERS